MSFFKFFPGAVTIKTNGGGALNERQQEKLLRYLRSNELAWRRRGHFELCDFFREMADQLERKSYIGVQILMTRFERAEAIVETLPRYAPN